MAKEYLGMVQSLVTDEGWDAVLQTMVGVFAAAGDGKQVDKLAQRMNSVSSRIDAYIACGKLKAAYLAAVRAKDRGQIERIHGLAVESGNRGVVGICEAYFAAQQ